MFRAPTKREKQFKEADEERPDIRLFLAKMEVENEQQQQQQQQDHDEPDRGEGQQQQPEVRRMPHVEGHPLRRGQRVKLTTR